MDTENNTPNQADNVSKAASSSSRFGIGVVAGIFFVSFIAGFFGAWSFSSMRGATTPSVAESRQKVIAEGEVVADIAENVSPSVVSIVTESTRNAGFLGSYSQSGAGTGVIISKDGYILTNKHVIPDTVREVEVITSDGKTYSDVQVIARDTLNDLAFLKVKDVNNLTPAKIGDSSDMSIGDKVVAIGNALGQFNTTVTSGILSGAHRSVEASGGLGFATETLTNMLQTDAAINPGNSGGPLVNISGEVIGVNTAVSQDAEGIGFAIPIDDAKGVIKSVLSSGVIKRAYLGVHYVTITPDVAEKYELKKNAGAYVISDAGNSAVVSDSPAAKVGIKENDIITKVNNVTLDNKHVLSSELAQFVPGDKIELTILRDGKEQTLKITLEEYRA